MKQYPLIGISIIAVVILLLASLSNVVGYQSVQSSSEQTIKERINQRELLFQTIVDIANNKEIQRIILKSQMSQGIFPTTEFPVVTKTQIRQMYFLGLILSKVVSKSRIQSLIGKYQFNNQEIQKEISTIIEKDTNINSEITQLKDSECDCENEFTMQSTFPVLCDILTIIAIGLIILCLIFGGISELFWMFHLPGIVPFTFVGIVILLIFILAIPFNLFDCPPIWEP